MITCSYCGGKSELVDGSVIYPHRPDLARKWFYLCRPCQAYVGCHPKTKNPLGRLANAELRKMKSAAHAAFDPIWRDGQMKRKEAYLALAKAMNLNTDDCHIGMFDTKQCNQVIEICEKGLMVA